MLGFGLAWACTDLVHAVTAAVSSYVDCIEECSSWYADFALVEGHTFENTWATQIDLDVRDPLKLDYILHCKKKV